MELGHLPLGAALVARVLGALVPVLQDLHRVAVFLDYHESGVGVGAVEAVGVVLGCFGVPGVEGHGEAVLGLDLPVVEHPLEREVLKAEGSVGIKENNELVVFNVLCEGGGFDPGGVAIFEFVRADKFVVIAVYDGVDVVTEDTARDVIQLAPVEDTVVEVFGRLERARLQIENQDVLAQVLRVSRFRGQGQRGEVEVVA